MAIFSLLIKKALTNISMKIKPMALFPIGLPINTEAAKRYKMKMQKEADMKMNMDSKDTMDNSKNMQN